MRLCLPLFLLACNPAEVKDAAVLFPTMHEVDGGFAAVFGFGGTANEAAREMDATFELVAGRVVVDDDFVDMELSVILVDGTIQSDLEEDGQAIVSIPVDFAGCDGVGFVEEADGGCTFAAGAVLTASQAITPSLRFDLKGQAPDDWDGDPDALAYSVVAEQAEPE